MSAEGQFTIFDARLQTPFSLIIAGPSSCGKTSFVINLLKNNRRVVSNPFDYILWFYGESFPRDEYFQNQPITFHQGLPDSFDSLINPSKRGLAIFDDLMAECGNSKLITEFFTKRTHHENVSVIFITQNLYSEGKERKNFAKNATYLCVFNRVFSRPVAWPVVTMETVGQTNQRTVTAGAQALSAHYIMLIRPLQALPLVRIYRKLFIFKYIF